MTTIDGDDDSYDEINKKWRKIWLNANGQRHRDGDKPAVIYVNGDVYYYKDGKFHRDGNLPAVIRDDGTVCYVKNDKLHRDGDLPAIIKADGYVVYYIDGKLVHPRLRGRKIQRNIDAYSKYDNQRSKI